MAGYDSEDRRAQQVRRRSDMNLEDEVHDLHQMFAVMSERMESMRIDIEKLVTRHEFNPVKLLAFGMAGGILLSVLTAIVSLVVRR